MSRRRNLVIVRVGPTSLHPSWVDGDSERNWDLRLLPYRELDDPADERWTVEDVVPGPKWSGLRTLLRGWEGWREYDYVWLPDDDIAASEDDISRMFDIAAGVGLDLFAPALHEDSHFAHFITMVNRRFHGRYVGFVEIMVPGFSSAALDRLLPTLDLSETGWGWGLDSAWPHLLGYENVGIIDATPVVHTRPVGEMRDAELAARVHAESDAILAHYGCRQMHSTFGAFGPDNTRVEMSPEELLREVVKGWDYLIERDPRVLAWIMEYHRLHFPSPDYPVAGTP